MSETFTASNGREIYETPTHSMTIDGRIVASPREAQALREFFQHERDEELGRWRWPENPDYVVYRDGTSRTVIRESDGGMMHVSLHDRKVMTTWLDSYVGAARAYDDAHPEPKPWHGAVQGELWELEVVGVSNWITVEAGDAEEPRPVFRDPHTMIQIELNDPKITAGRRIYPEGDTNE